MEQAQESTNVEMGRMGDQSFANRGFFESLRTMPRGVWSISLFGLFLGMSTTMVYSQLSLFLANELHATAVKVAAIDGLVELCAFITRIFSGYISDLLHERKLILVIGCTVTLIARPLMTLAQSAYMVLGIQSIERIGNGLQATPRDALIADLSSRQARGGAFGFTRSLKTFGAMLGTPIAMYIMIQSSNNFRLVFGVATIPVVIALLCILSIRKPNEQANTRVKQENPFKRKYLKSLDRSFWKLLLLTAVFELGHFTEHLLPIYTNQFLPIERASIVNIFISVGQVLLAFPIGYLADKYGRSRFIRCCMICMVMANILYIVAGYNIIAVPVICILTGAFLWGGQMSAIQGLFLSIISEQVNFKLRATAIGIYYCIVGVCYCLSSLIAGYIWDNFGARYTFVYSICFSILAFVLSFALLPKKYSGGCSNN